MHELGITSEMIGLITARLASEERHRVRRVVLEIGSLAAVLPDSIRFCFELCARETAVEGALLEIREIPARGACRSCSRPVESTEPYAACLCGSSDIDWRQGQELRIKELEMELE